ncbi:MAG: alpha/beta fold hydrolase [Bacteroidota bacterium]
MFELEYPYPAHYLQLTESVRLAYVDEGEGQPLLFIHGLGSNLKGWQKTIDGLRQHFRCLAIDLPGYGNSSQGKYPFDMSFFAGVVRDFIAALGLRKVVLVGHSMGGQIAMQTVLQNAKSIEKLVLLAPAGFETFDEKEKRFFATVWTPQLLKAMPVAQIVRNFELNFHDMPDDSRFMIADRLALRQTKAFDHFCRMVPKCLMGMLNEPVYGRLHYILQPTLILYGENDQLIPSQLVHPLMTTRQVAEKGYRRLPASHLEMVKDAGHFLQWERAKEVNAAIFSFLK